MITGHATPEGTARYAARFPQHLEFYRPAGDLTVSSLGIGTYLGQPDEATDDSYTAAVLAGLRGGINFIDTSLNYRNQRSERAVGSALREAVNTLAVHRDEVLVCTKAGFLTPGAVPTFLTAEDVVARAHSMTPEFLTDQVERSRANLGLDTIDVLYLHNPETQLAYVDRETFEIRIRMAFERLERLADDKRIRWYGTATWDGYRKPGQLDLERLAEIAREEGGENHRFRFVQLPFNLGMVEAFSTGPKSVLQSAERLGINVVASATLLQGRAIAEMPEAVGELLPGLTSDAQRAIQFTRSTPGIGVALVGMSSTGHVEDNLGIGAVAPATRDEYLRLFQ